MVYIVSNRSENSELMERVKNAEWNLNKKLTEKAALVTVDHHYSIIWPFL